MRLTGNPPSNPITFTGLERPIGTCEYAYKNSKARKLGGENKRTNQLQSSQNVLRSMLFAFFPASHSVSDTQIEEVDNPDGANPVSVVLPLPGKIPAKCLQVIIPPNIKSLTNFNTVRGGTQPKLVLNLGDYYVRMIIL